ncbi:MAG: alpha/beta hydrolase [Verrucomicrobiota bacterium]|nr:alpha/beta hydrolase [Verrucomicrobiota bacterium]
MKTLKKHVIRPILLITITLAILYAVVNILGVWIQNYAMFPIPRVYGGILEGESVLPTPSGDKITVLSLDNPAAKQTILFSHGNGEDLNRIEPYLHELRNLGFNVVAYDYRGYGRSEGKPSEKALEEDILSVYEWIIRDKKVSPEQIILLGRSMGGGPSVWLAGQKPVSGLILESTFTSAYEVMLPPLPYYRNPFPTQRRLRNLRVPVLFIHGTADLLIQPHHARKNFEAAHEPKQIVWIQGAGHNDAYQTDPRTYQESILQFSRKLNDSTTAVSKSVD